MSSVQLQDAKISTVGYFPTKAVFNSFNFVFREGSKHVHRRHNVKLQDTDCFQPHTQPQDFCESALMIIVVLWVLS